MNRIDFTTVKPEDARYRGVPMMEMSKEELVEIVLEMSEMYMQRVEELRDVKIDQSKVIKTKPVMSKWRLW